MRLLVRFTQLEPHAPLMVSRSWLLYLKWRYTKGSRAWETPPLATAHQLMKTGGLWNTFVTIGFWECLSEAFNRYGAIGSK